MFFKEIIETAQSVALANKLRPTEISIYEKICREYSKLFHTELTKVYDLSPEFVFTQLYSNQLESWDEEERLPEILEMIYSLSDPNYDASKEAAIKEETQRIIEEEERRIMEKKPIHSSLGKSQSKAIQEDPIPKELPKSGGINMALINQLKNEENN